MSTLVRSVGGIVIRPIRPSDEPRLYEIYVSTRQAEMDQSDLSESEKESFLKMQFGAQHRDYFSNYPSAEYSAIVLDDRVVGRLYVDRRQDEIRILDIALLPDHRNSGIGGAVLATVLQEARALGRPVRLHARQDNSGALNLYRRLGFRLLREVPPYYLLEWNSTDAQRER